MFIIDEDLGCIHIFPGNDFQDFRTESVISDPANEFGFCAKTRAADCLVIAFATWHSDIGKAMKRFTWLGDPWHIRGDIHVDTAKY
jgi:hypothetical protein